MDRNEYCDRVLAQVGRLTSGEARDLRAELSGHIEDHAEALTALGYGEDEAGERAVMLMGDPEETGRALDRAVGQRDTECANSHRKRYCMRGQGLYGHSV